MPESGNTDASGGGFLVALTGDEPDFPEEGLLPVIVQDRRTGEVLMLAWSDRHAFIKTRREGLACFYSRSRKEYWTKGETSGHFLKVHRILTDCDRDTLLYLVDPHGPTCHRDTRTCFVTDPDPGRPSDFGYIADLEETIRNRLAEDSDESYVASLGRRGLPKMLGKIGEEAMETAVSAIAESDDRLMSEAADLLFHLLVLLQYKRISFADVAGVLRRRAGVGGLEEKRSRNADS